MLIITLLFSLFALPNAHHTKLLHRVATTERPQILVIISPGWDEQMASPLLEHLWRKGFSVWSLRFAQHAQDLDQMSESIERALDHHTDPVVVVHGFSSIALLNTLPRTKSKIRGLAFLGAPLEPFCSPAIEESLHKNTWDNFSDLPIQYASSTFHQIVYTWCKGKHGAYDIGDIHHVWSASTNINPIAPPESIRPHLSTQHRFIRSGPLALHGREPSSVELVQHKPTLNDLSSRLWDNTPWRNP